MPKAGIEIKEFLINSEIPATQGGAAIFDGNKPLKMKERKNRIFSFRALNHSRMELFRASLKESSRILCLA
jgi:hypothetical protein